MDAGAIYADTRGRIVQLVQGLSADDLARAVPATPRWTVRELVCHLTGVCADVVEGRLDGVTTEPWTAAQVDARRDRSLDEVLTEWSEWSPEVEDRLRQFGQVMGAMVADVATHEQDLRAALGPPGGRESAGMDFALQMLVGALDARLKEKGLALGLRAGNQEWEVGEGDPKATVTAPDVYELNRALNGRRSRAQVAGFAWAGDPDPYLDLFSIFPAAETDQLE
jgi:uncharacterized protein (TIGR03083 family)